MPKGPCKHCGCKEYDETYVTTCHVLQTCKESEDEQAFIASLKAQVSELREYAKATEYWKIEPHDQKERAAWIARLAVKPKEEKSEGG